MFLTLALNSTVAKRRGLEIIGKFKVVFLELLDDRVKCNGLFLLWGHGVPLFVFADNLVLVKGGFHQLVFGDVAPVVVLILLCPDVE